MAWIEEADPADGNLPEIFRAMSLNLQGLEAVKALNETLSFGGSGLTRVQEESIATVVAVANQCRYAALTHAGFIRRTTRDHQLAAMLLNDYTQANLAPTDRLMLDFALKLTQRPSSIAKADVEKLRQAGLKDRQVLAVVLLTCLYNFMDRLADGLGVDVPQEYQKLVDSWLTGPVAQQPWLMQPKGE
jgi:uncharacterized peroxidase-related enzyme